MEVILLKELRGRGGEGDVIDVSRGFANNYLLRQGYAIKATPGNLKQLEERRKNIEKREEVRIANANELAEKLNGLTVNVTVQVGEEGQLFGFVTAPMIADAIVDMGIEIDKRRVELGKPITRWSASSPWTSASTATSRPPSTWSSRASRPKPTLPSRQKRPPKPQPRPRGRQSPTPSRPRSSRLL